MEKCLALKKIAYFRCNDQTCYVGSDKNYLEHSNDLFKAYFIK